MSGLLLRLAGPLQSWGERSVFTAVRDSAPFPTRSGLIGMFAAAEGLPRDSGEIAKYSGLQFVVRVDRPGIRMSDFHTVGGGFPDELTVLTSAGKHKKTAVITRRQYLADAVFAVGVTGPEQMLEALVEALDCPHWSPYLGRRSCPPDEPFVLRSDVPDIDRALCESVPLSRAAAGHEAEVTFLYESLPDDVPEEQADVITVNDRPVHSVERPRGHATRRLYRVTRRLPAELSCAHRELLPRLISYVQEGSAA